MQGSRAHFCARHAAGRCRGGSSCRAFRPAPGTGVGRRHQKQTGLHYNWHRSYDPTVGRYTQPDPLGFVDGPSVYAYAGGSPAQAVDYNGLISGLPSPNPFPGISQQCSLKDRLKDCLRNAKRNAKMAIIQCMMLITGEDGPTPPPPPTPPPITRPGPPPPPPPPPPSGPPTPPKP